MLYILHIIITNSNATNNRHHKGGSSSCSCDLEKVKRAQLPKRDFSSTQIKRGDPLGTAAAAFAYSYASSLLVNPLSASILILIGMGSTLFLLTGGLPAFFSVDPEYASILMRLDSILLLYERFIITEQSMIDLLFANLNNFSPETLNNFYYILQELVTVRESMFTNLSALINSPDIEFLHGPILDRINQVFENLRYGGNDLMHLVREIETRLDIPEDARIPTF